MKIYKNWLIPQVADVLRFELNQTHLKSIISEYHIPMKEFLLTLNVNQPISNKVTTLLSPREKCTGTTWHRDPGDISGIVALHKNPVELLVRDIDSKIVKYVTRNQYDLIILDNNKEEHFRCALSDEQASKHQILNLQISYAKNP